MPTNDFSIIPTDEELLLRMKNFEDHFVERKTIGDAKDWLKTAVAFANSAPIGFPCVLYIGLRDDGTPEQRQESSNLEKLQKSFSDKVKPAYPPIAYFPRVLRIEDQQVLAVNIPGSELKPHFTQRPHIRVGQQTLETSDPQFEELIAQRSSKNSLFRRGSHTMASLT
jgi:predicted HTH transcriptional regulator